MMIISAVFAIVALIMYCNASESADAKGERLNIEDDDEDIIK